MKTLAILIPTMPSRKSCFDFIYNKLRSQIGERKVGILLIKTGTELSVGTKRQALIEQAHKLNFDYVAHVDDDDDISDDYIKLIYDAIQQEPDVVGMRGYMTTNGQNRESWSINTKYNWAENVDGFRYVRYPNHLSPIKLEHALEAGFKDMKHGEDYEYSMALKRLGKLQKQVFIDSEVYHYKFRTVK